LRHCAEIKDDVIAFLDFTLMMAYRSAVKRTPFQLALLISVLRLPVDAGSATRVEPSTNVWDSTDNRTPATYRQQ
jgi:hypothetical protein